MLALSVVDLFLPSAIVYGWSVALAALGVGVGLVFALNTCIAVTGLADTEPLFTAAHGTQDTNNAAQRKRRSALLTVLALALHNAPEGVLVAITATQPDQRHLYLIVLSVGLHNIPEGISAAVSIYNATGNRVQAVVGGSAS